MSIMKYQMMFETSEWGEIINWFLLLLFYRAERIFSGNDASHSSSSFFLEIKAIR